MSIHGLSDLIIVFLQIIVNKWGRGCGSFGRTVISNNKSTRVWIQASKYFYAANPSSVEKTQINKEKEAPIENLLIFTRTYELVKTVHIRTSPSTQWTLINVWRPFSFCLHLLRYEKRNPRSDQCDQKKSPNVYKCLQGCTRANQGFL